MIENKGWCLMIKLRYEDVAECCDLGSVVRAGVSSSMVENFRRLAAQAGADISGWTPGQVTVIADALGEDLFIEVIECIKARSIEDGMQG